MLRAPENHVGKEKQSAGVRPGPREVVGMLASSSAQGGKQVEGCSQGQG